MFVVLLQFITLNVGLGRTPFNTPNTKVMNTFTNLLTIAHENKN
jgi:hypothetical protein